MSASVDRERAQLAAEDRSYRIEALLLQMLELVRLRRRNAPVTEIATKLQLGRRSVYDRIQTLDSLIESIQRKGYRQS